MADGYTIKRIDEFEEMEGSGGATWRLARKTPGPRPSASTSSTSSGGQIPAHDHSGDDQEEVFIILEGDGVIIAGDEEPRRRRDLLPLRPGGPPHDPQQVGRAGSRAAHRSPARQRLPGNALGLAGLLS